MLMHNATLVFDLDGTLVDTAPDLVAATNHALADLSLPPVPAETLRHAIGFGARRMIVVGLKETGVILDEPEIDRLLARFLAYYEPNLAQASRPFEGAVAALEKFRSEGARLAVCTNKPQAHTEELLARLGIRANFAAVAGVDTYAFHKPDPRHLLQVISDAGGTAKRAVMVGDTKVDIRTARAAEVPIIGLGHGYSDIPIAQLNPDVTLDDFVGLADAIESIRSQLPSHS